MSHCPYCSLSPSNTGDVFCSRRMQDFGLLGNGIFLIAGSDIHSEEHLSRFALRFALHGQMNFRIGNERHRLDSRGVLLFSENSSYTLDTTAASSAHVGIAFNPRFFRSAAAALLREPEYLIEGPDPDIELPFIENTRWPDTAQSNYFGRLLLDFAQRPGGKDPLIVNDIAFRVLEWYMKEAAAYRRLLPKFLNVQKTSTRFELVQRLRIARELVEYSDPAVLTISLLAAESGLSEFHFIRLYTQLFALTPHRHIIAKRMERALGMLHNTAVPIGEIAFCCGYSDHAAFSRMFKDHYGSSPTSIRNKSGVQVVIKSDLN